MNLLEELYEPRVATARTRLETDLGLQKLLDPRIEPKLLERFLIHFSAVGVHMTEPVEAWIRRAGQRCTELGLADTGQALITHARHEAGHHRMMMEDTHFLVNRWNARYHPLLDAQALLSNPPTPAVHAYVALHEEVIASQRPWGQVAIEYEIERMSTKLGPPLIEQCLRVLGREITEGLSFMTEHVELDVGHTALNAKMLARLLEHKPQDANGLAEIGARGLGAYLDFLDECLVTAEQQLQEKN